MKSIRVLETHVANQIAAGEVVERPASIVKELVENSIDAGATSISVEIAGGGVELIRVTDNGAGIPAGEVALAFKRHATSKITTSDELSRVSTLGFRGEALPSIASVSQLELTTRTQENEVGACITIAGGEITAQTDAPCPVGSSVKIQNVFFNTPARLKFLKSPQAEAGYIDDYMTRLILSMPEISFKFINNAKLIYHSPGDGSLQNALLCVYGRELLHHLKEVTFDDGYIRVHGFVGAPEHTRANRAMQSFFINRRYIKSSRLSAAVQAGYDTQLMKGRFPFSVLNLTLASGEVDVNVHPNKLEARFRDEQRISASVRAAVEQAITGMEVRTANLPGLTDADDDPVGRLADNALPLSTDKTAERLMDVELRENAGDRWFKLRETAALPGIEEYVLKSEVAASEGSKREVLKGEQTGNYFDDTPFELIGQVFECYWFIQKGERLYILDQHAVHERKLYDKYSAEMNGGASQRLLTPLSVRLSALEYARFNENRELFEQLGFEIEPFGTQTVLLRAVPYMLGEPQLEQFLHSALSALENASKTAPAELKREELIQSACKHAVKGGEAISREEILTLLGSLKEDDILTCPHGRPIMVRLTKRDFEKMFKRIV